MIAFRQTMAHPEARINIAGNRVIEFCHAWIKSTGVRQFHLRGLAKVHTEML